MKINSYKKKKSNLYEITLSNKNKINLYDDVILKYGLLLKKELSEKELVKILQDNALYESYYKAVKFINSKLRTEKEIRKKLANYSKEAIEYTIERLKKEDYLNDYVYIKAYINDAVNLKMVGPNKIHYELKKLGFKDNDILNYLNTFENNVWLDKIKKIIQKRINSNHNLSSIVLKQKIYQDLNNRGFNREDIDLVIDDFTFDDQDIYLKEYEKAKNKLSKKYSEEELEYQVKAYLYKKGFRL